MKTRLCVGMTALVVAAFAGGWLLGDDKKPDEPPVKFKGQLPAHYKKLGLTDKQVQDIYKVQSVYHEKVEPLIQQIEDLKKAERLEVENVLTDEQKAHLLQILTADVPDKDKPAPVVKDKPPPTDKDKTASPDKDKTASPDKDKPPPTDKDKEKDK